MYLTQILTQRRQGAKKSVGFELLPSPLAGEGPGVRGCGQSLAQVHNPDHFWACPRACGSPAAIWPRRAASECAATLSLDLDSFLKSFRGSQPSLALIGSAARARR